MACSVPMPGASAPSASRASRSTPIPRSNGRRGLTTGANENDKHVRNVDVGRDIVVDEWIDLRTVTDGEACPRCGSSRSSVFKAIEVGHIFKLGTFYAEPLGMTVLDENGKAIPVVMGSYGIGVERNMAASIEANHDDKGIVWPLEIAPVPRWSSPSSAPTVAEHARRRGVRSTMS